MKGHTVETRKFNIHEAAERLGVSTITLRRILRRNEISCFRPTGRGAGRKLLFSEAHLKDFEQRHTFESQEG